MDTKSFVTLAVVLVVIAAILVIIENAVKNGKKVGIYTPFASVEFNNDTPAKQALINAKA